MSIIDKELEKAIASLPKSINDVVVKRLQEADNLEIQVKDLKNQIDKLNHQYTNQSIVIQKQDLEIKELNELKLRAKALDNKERGLEVSQLNHELNIERQTRTEIHGLVALLMKNPRAIEILNTSTVIGQDYHNDGSRSSYPMGEQGTKEMIESKD